MHSGVVFAVGMVGALAPEIVRLYGLRNSPQQFSRFYLVASAAFAALGGIVALLLPATTLWAAFYAGISTPTLISTAVKKGIDIKQPKLRSAPESGVAAPPSAASFFRAL